MKTEFLARGLLALTAAMAMSLAAQAAPVSGNILVLNADKGTGSHGQLEVVAPSTAPGGAVVTVLSDFGNASQGPLGSSPESITVVPGAALGLTQPVIIVADPTAGTGQNGLLFSIDPATGNRTKLTDFGTTTKGPLGHNPISVVMDANVLGLGNRLLVLDSGAGASARGAIFAVDPTTGIRTIVADLGDDANNALNANQPTQIAVSPNLAGLPGSTILLVDATAGTTIPASDQASLSSGGALFTINGSGKRTLLSDFGNAAQGPTSVSLQGVIAAPGLLGLGNQLLVVDELGGTSFMGALYSVNTNGIRTLISDFGSASQGPLGGDPSNLALKQTCVLVACTNTLYVADRSSGDGTNLFGFGRIFELGANGARTVAADFNPRLPKFQFGASLPGMAIFP